MLDYEGDTHIYLQIAAILRERVAGLPAGEPIPSEAEIQEEFGVARTTARRAVHVLREEGLIYTVQGEGAFVGPSTGAPRKQRKVPLYQQIASDLTEQIKAGKYQPRRPIPGETALVKQYGVARETVRRAMALLRERGWIYTVAQRGSYVSQKDSWPET
ncbi:GntR family transcriptional regulator [Nonomuraea sp. FMUSA5-5]|uniref:GntR family transcriptional regulator n=1 Tax=Nonomuraea composti TaxID=2720023 RepID=A0ABX1B9K2_9ACTN|nr:GntR family transcriptional regulator [Nonomuraea sp. FMUSA5-5]